MEFEMTEKTQHCCCLLMETKYGFFLDVVIFARAETRHDIRPKKIYKAQWCKNQNSLS